MRTLYTNLRFGDGTNGLTVAQANGQQTWTGTYLKKLTLRPGIVNTQNKVNDLKPTEVYRGINVGYSFPIYNSDAEELNFRMRIPIRWDGVTDPQFVICATINSGGTEDVGDKFKFQMEWQTTSAGNEMNTTVSSTTSEQTILTGRSAAYDTYFLFFNFNADDVNNPLVAGSMLQARIRRIAASSSEVAREPIIWDWATMWAIKYVYGNWSVETNAT